VLYVIGEQSGAVFEEGVELLRSLVPQTREARVPGVDHRLQMQNPALVAEKIAEFLRDLPS
jgi:pimeloyl-ACP methyl ester carboxylesterase